ncbi:MAG: chloramphenicol acetyltransferase [Methylobacterium sp.]|nr:chloramphenicol acetyltransferase [Methylobacterium sp.]
MPKDLPPDPRLGPDPDALHPVPDHARIPVLRNLPLPDAVAVGAYTYYDDPAGPGTFLDNILSHSAFLGDRLRIGRFCALAAASASS